MMFFEKVSRDRLKIPLMNEVVLIVENFTLTERGCGKPPQDVNTRTGYSEGVENRSLEMSGLWL